MSVSGEVHLFVLWEHARTAEKRILEDIRAKFDVLAAVPASWPENMSAATAFKRFYGTFLVDPAGKAVRAGSGEFLVVVVRDPNPVYRLVETVRGLEKVDINIFNLKYDYRSWVGGQHRVHGTNSTEEAQRDIMLLTGRPLSEWIDGTAAGKPLSVLKNTRDWPTLRELFSFLNETAAYAVLRNGNDLPDAFDPLHDDIDMLVENLSDCVSLLNARKIGNAGSLYAVNVAGREIKCDIRSVGDGYYDEAWQRNMLNTRVKNAKNVFVLSPENHFHALVYHAVFQKRFIAADYPAKAADAAAAIGVPGKTFADWTRALEKFMAENRYRPSRPADASVRLNTALLDWHVHAVEAARIFGLSGVCLSEIEARALDGKHSHTEIILDAERDGTAVRIEYGRHLSAFGDLQFKTASAFFSAAPEYAIRPLDWHVGRKGAYFVWKKTAGQSLRARLLYGKPLSADEADRFAADALKILDGLEKGGVHHRDIRPENLFLAENGAIRLTGFRFAVKRETYSKEIPWLRKDPLSRLTPVGGDFVREPGRWNDAWSLAKCLELLPQTESVTAAREKLLARSRSAAAAVSVRLPPKKRIAMFFAWLRFVISDAAGLNGQSKKKHKARRRFAFNAFRAF